MKHSFGSLYDDLRYSYKLPLLYHSIFILRRISFALVAVLLTHWPFFQVIWYFVQSVLIITYNLKVQPFKEPIHNYLEVFNEICIAFCGFHLIAFTDFVDDSRTKYNAGWSMILLTLTNIFVNLVVIVIFTVRLLKFLYKKLRFKFMKRKVRKSFADFRQPRKLTTFN